MGNCLWGQSTNYLSILFYPKHWLEGRVMCNQEKRRILLKVYLNGRLCRNCEPFILKCFQLKRAIWTNNFSFRSLSWWSRCYRTFGWMAFLLSLYPERSPTDRWRKMTSMMMMTGDEVYSLILINVHEKEIKGRAFHFYTDSSYDIFLFPILLSSHNLSLPFDLVSYFIFERSSLVIWVLGKETTTESINFSILIRSLNLSTSPSISPLISYW